MKYQKVMKMGVLLILISAVSFASWCFIAIGIISENWEVNYMIPAIIGVILSIFFILVAHKILFHLRRVMNNKAKLNDKFMLTIGIISFFFITIFGSIIVLIGLHKYKTSLKLNDNQTFV